MKIYMITNALETSARFLSDNGLLAMTVTLAGLAAIFFVLGIVWFAMRISKYLLGGAREKGRKISADSGVLAPADTPAGNLEHAGTVAAITAAIAAFYAANGTANAGFRVVSFKRTGIRPWNAK